MTTQQMLRSREIKYSFHGTGGAQLFQILLTITKFYAPEGDLSKLLTDNP